MGRFLRLHKEAASACEYLKILCIYNKSRNKFHTLRKTCGFSSAHFQSTISILWFIWWFSKHNSQTHLHTFIHEIVLTHKRLYNFLIPVTSCPPPSREYRPLLRRVGRPRCFNFLQKSRWRRSRGANTPYYGAIRATLLTFLNLVNSVDRNLVNSTKYEKSFVYVLRAKELAKKTVLRSWSTCCGQNVYFVQDYTRHGNPTQPNTTQGN